MLPPIRKTITVTWDQARAFRRFTEEMGTWWPLRSHSVGGDQAETVVFESRPGGRIVERIKGGKECVWGTVKEWDPPRRVSFTWHPGRGPMEATLVELTFEPLPGGTRLLLVHSRWEALGKLARTARRGYPIGWAYVLRLWADRGSSPVVWGIHALQWLLSPLQRRLARKNAAPAAPSP